MSIGGRVSLACVASLAVAAVGLLRLLVDSIASLVVSILRILGGGDVTQRPSSCATGISRANILE